MTNPVSVLVADELARLNAELSAIRQQLPLTTVHGGAGSGNDADPGVVAHVWDTWPIVTHQNIRLRSILVITDDIGPTDGRVSLMVDQQEKFTMMMVATIHYKFDIPWELPNGVKIWLRDWFLVATNTPPFDLVPGTGQGIFYAALFGYAS